MNNQITMEHINLSSSLSLMNNKSEEEYTLWLEQVIKINKQTSLFYFIHISNFLQKYSSSLGIKSLVYLEKQFYFSLDLKLLDWSEKILNNLKSVFSNEETKIKRMEADLIQITQTKDIESENLCPLEDAINAYKRLIKENQHDQISLKNYLALVKSTVTLDDIRTLIDLMNEYLKVFMDDAEVWYDLADIYISTLNYNKAIFCLEEVVLHNPNDYSVYIKIGDLLNSFNNTESSGIALKYYCKSILIKPTPRAFWGIIYIKNIFSKYKKPTDESMNKSFKIASENLKRFYPKGYAEELLA